MKLRIFRSFLPVHSVPSMLPEDIAGNWCRGVLEADKNCVVPEVGAARILPVVAGTDTDVVLAGACVALRTADRSLYGLPSRTCSTHSISYRFTLSGTWIHCSNINVFCSLPLIFVFY